jgi:predicted nucleic-acid-binding Zn-ribbon protein
MYYCTLEKCVHPRLKKRDCYHHNGVKCEKAKFGCPKCHSENIAQSRNLYWLVCKDCGYKEFDD